MLPPTTDATATIYDLDRLLSVPFAEVRPATDLAKDPWGQIIDKLTGATNPQRHKASAAARVLEPGTSIGETDLLRDGPPLAGMNPWLVDTMAIIDAHRKGLAGNQYERTVRSLLESAEMLASFITDISASRRPQLNIEPSGRPTFATATDDFYIHLTVDEPKRLTWYAVVGGTEHFDEGVAFDGRRLPSGLAQLFSL
jgi:hypothetical protein